MLVGLLSNWYESQRLQNDPNAKEKLGVDPKEWQQALVPRNGFRYARGGGRHFDAQPGIHPTNVVLPGDIESTEAICQLVGNGIYIGRLWYTYPVNGMRAGDFTGTVVADSYVIKDGKLAEPVTPQHAAHQRQRAERDEQRHRRHEGGQARPRLGRRRDRLRARDGREERPPRRHRGVHGQPVRQPEIGNRQLDAALDRRSS